MAAVLTWEFKDWNQLWNLLVLRGSPPHNATSNWKQNYNESLFAVLFAQSFSPFPPTLLKKGNTTPLILKDLFP